MAIKAGQARVLTLEQQGHLLQQIEQHRYPEKNKAIMLISFRLGLRVQEIALLQLKEICQLAPAAQDAFPANFKLLETMTLPAAYTKGANALNRSQSHYQRRRIGFSVEEFDQVVKKIEIMAKAGATIDTALFYPPARKHKGKSRDLPLVDQELREALTNWLHIRLAKDPGVRPSDPLFLTQKGGSYSPNTLQLHMSKMLQKWAGIEKATSHSGRRSLLTDVIHKQNNSTKVAQKIAGHASPATTVLYEEPSEETISEALSKVAKPT